MAFTILLCAGGCAEPAGSAAGLSLIAPTAQWEDDRFVVRTGLEADLTPAVLEALNNGVALVLNVQTDISRKHWLIDRRSDTRNHRLEIRYLPLSRHYRLSNLKQDTQLSYPRLWMLLASLEDPTAFDTGLTRTALGGQAWRVRTRVHLEISRLPPPMRLPAWFSGAWRLRSDWHHWEIDPGAAVRGIE